MRRAAGSAGPPGHKSTTGRRIRRAIDTRATPIPRGADAPRPPRRHARQRPSPPSSQAGVPPARARLQRPVSAGARATEQTTRVATPTAASARIATSRTSRLRDGKPNHGTAARPRPLGHRDGHLAHPRLAPRSAPQASVGESRRRTHAPDELQASAVARLGPTTVLLRRKGSNASPLSSSMRPGSGTRSRVTVGCAASRSASIRGSGARSAGRRRVPSGSGAGGSCAARRTSAPPPSARGRVRCRARYSGGRLLV